jgi:hypothetical protein
VAGLADDVGSWGVKRTHSGHRENDANDPGGVESKSGYFINDFNESSDETANSVPRLINRL